MELNMWQDFQQDMEKDMKQDMKPNTKICKKTFYQQNTYQYTKQSMDTNKGYGTGYSAKCRASKASIETYMKSIMEQDAQH